MIGTKTVMATPSTIKQQWLLVDANDVVLGRLATEVARLLRGKHKADFTPHMDMGDHVVVINASQIKVTGRKAEGKEGKLYHHHTGYPGGIKEESYADLHARAPERVIQKAVKGMLPKGPLGYAMLKRLRVYAGAEHPHMAQCPASYSVKDAQSCTAVSTKKGEDNK